jgi:membrane associated rhomboid family serine protease
VAEERFDPQEAREIISFQIFYNQRQIKATWALAVVIVIMYLLEEFFGGSQNTAVLVRMGANVSERVKAGEFYRLATAVFLHAGLLHVFFNTYVLFALGGFFNRILGEARFLTVFFISGLAGSLASVFLGKSGVSVGASGAIWGLFGASLALAFFKTSLLPEAIRLRLRRVALINLVINLGISFLPMIDFWAHVGGGVGGFLVSLALIFPPKSVQLQSFVNLSFKLVASILTLVYSVSLAYVLWLFQPWMDPLDLKLVPVALEKIPFLIAMPEGLKQVSGKSNSKGSSYFVFGDPQMDQLVLEVHFFDESVLGAKPNKDWLMAQRKELLVESVPQEVRKSIYVRETVDDTILYYQQSAPNTDIAIHNYVITRDTYGIKLAIVAASKQPKQKIDELALKIIQSIEIRR